MPDKLGDAIRLKHVSESIRLIEQYTRDVDYQEFAENSLIADACIRQLGIIWRSLQSAFIKFKESVPIGSLAGNRHAQKLCHSPVFRH